MSSDIDALEYDILQPLSAVHLLIQRLTFGWRFFRSSTKYSASLVLQMLSYMFKGLGIVIRTRGYETMD